MLLTGVSCGILRYKNCAKQWQALRLLKTIPMTSMDRVVWCRALRGKEDHSISNVLIHPAL